MYRMDLWGSIGGPVRTTDEKITDRGGSQYYMAVIGGDFVHPVYFVPKAIKLDDCGQPIKSKYPSAQQPYWTADIGPPGSDGDSVDNRKVEEWKTPAPALQKLGASEKSAVNAVKKWLNGNDTAVWYHNANSDFCSRFGGPHLHCIVQQPGRNDGTFPLLHNQNSFANAVKFCKLAGGYCKAQAVKSLRAAMVYFNTPPRVFMGTRSCHLGRFRKQVLDQPESSFEGVPWADDDTGDEVGAGPSTPKRHQSDFDSPDDVDHGGSVGKRPRLDDWSDSSLGGYSSEQRADVCVNPGAPRKDVTGLGDLHGTKELRETSGDRLSRVLECIMRYVNAYDYEVIISKVSDLNPSDPVYVTWNRLVRRPGTVAAILRIRDGLKSLYQNFTLNEMAAQFLQSEDSKKTIYYSPAESLELLGKWCQYNGIVFGEFCKRVQEVMDRKVPKKNTLLVIGPSNSGKTIFLKRTLEPLTPFSAQIGGVGNAGQFLWQMCPGARAIYIEECRLAPEHIETAKLIFGGEPATVDVKCKPPSRVGRVPVFISSNHMPWLLAPAAGDKEALENRMHVFNVQSDGDLRSIEKDLHPGLWWYVTEALKRQEDSDALTVEDCLKFSFSSDVELDCEID